MAKIDQQIINYQVVCQAATLDAKTTLSPRAKKSISRTRDAIEKVVSQKKIVYGVTTGFGSFKNTAIDTSQVQQLQENLILSHAVGVGPAFEPKIVRGIMFLMANYLSKGHSGVRPVVVEKLIEFLNKNVIPFVPQKGSVGSSGDLAPSAHVVLTMLGKGEVLVEGKRVDTKVQLNKLHISPLRLEAKEGLALINNTATMTANACFAMDSVEYLLDLADQAGALSAEALRATNKAFDSRIHTIRPHAGQILVAKRMRQLLQGSSMIDNTKVQDQYSLRCIPQIHGAVREAVDYVRKVVDTEVNSVTDNPLIFAEGKDSFDVISGGNFHGEPVAIAMDTLGIATSELGNISDRRIASLLDPATNNKLPAFLTPHGGLNSGMMILQYATAALASENKVLAHPASVDSIPTSANVEDLVSMGTIAARKARDIAENVTNILAIELLVACQAIDFRLKEGLKLGKQTNDLYKKIRKIVPFFEQDAVYYPYVTELVSLINSKSL